MMMLIDSPSADFNSPLEMLRACHGRIQNQCATLSRLHAYLFENGNDEQAKQAALAILRYFDTAGQYHHQDEEIDLFPPLIASQDAPVQALVRELLAQHQVLNARWLALRSALTELCADRIDTLDTRIVEEFLQGYASHIELENGQLLPQAAALLSPTQLATLGQHMAKRRGVTI